MDLNAFALTQDCEWGLSFADEKNILDFDNQGTKIVEVIIPEKDSVIMAYGKYKTHTIILRRTRNL